jgi:hypothetical protein
MIQSHIRRKEYVEKCTSFAESEGHYSNTNCAPSLAKEIFLETGRFACMVDAVNLKIYLAVTSVEMLRQNTLQITDTSKSLHDTNTHKCIYSSDGTPSKDNFY